MYHATPAPVLPVPEAGAKFPCITFPSENDGVPHDARVRVSIRVRCGPGLALALTPYRSLLLGHFVSLLGKLKLVLEPRLQIEGDFGRLGEIL